MASSLLWRHKFKKLSRTLSINTDFNWSSAESRGLLYSLNNYYDSTTLIEKDTTDQMNILNNETKNISSKIAYTEPLMKDIYLEISHSISFNSNSNDRSIYVKNGNGKYEEPVDSLSNSFVFDRLVNTPGLNFKVNKKKYNISFGSSIGFSHFVQKNNTANSTINYDNVNFFPKVSFNFKPKPSDNIRIYYNGSSSAPTLEQLQPTRVNTDPLNIYIGNPGLEQSFRHSFSTSYNSYRVLKEKYINFSLSYSFTQKAFIQSSTIDRVGKRTYQTVNADGNYSFSFYSNYSFKITKVKIGLGFGPTGNISRNIDIVNGKRNETTSSNYGIRINIDKYVPNKFNFYISPSFSWRQSEATVNKSANAEYWQMDGWANVTVTFLKKFEISSDANVQVRQKDPRFSQKNNYTTWNASLTRRMFKNNALEIKFSVNDILDQNKGYQRNFNSNSFSETYYTALRRFWLLTLTWNLAKNGKPAGFN